MYLFFFIIICFFFFPLCLPKSPPTTHASLNSTWMPVIDETILLRIDYAAKFVQTCSRSNYLYYFAVTENSPFLYDDCDANIPVWVANRNAPVTINATLSLTTDGNLVLSEGSVKVWSSDTSGFGVVGMEILESGNLILVDRSRNIIWQSFDHPTDVLLPQQQLLLGKKLIASLSKTNKSEGSFYLQLQPDALIGFAKAPVSPQPYLLWNFSSNSVAYVLLGNATIDAYDAYHTLVDSVILAHLFNENPPSLVRFLKLHHDGAFRSWLGVHLTPMILSSTADAFGVCGKYSISRAGNCSCLDFDPSLQFNRDPTEGCVPTDRIDTQACRSDRHNSSHYRLIQAKGYDYLPLQFMQEEDRISENECQESCISDCSCVAAFVHEYGNRSSCARATELVRD